MTSTIRSSGSIDKPIINLYQSLTKGSFPTGWEDAFKECERELYESSQYVKKNCTTIYPRPEKVFNAMLKCPMMAVKVIILGQDPYPNLTKNGLEPQAQGLAFSVPKGEKIPSSLNNIFKELILEYGSSEVAYMKPTHGDLGYWAEQGVLLLNCSLTFDPSATTINQHFKKGIWKPFIIRLLKYVKRKNPNVVFLLWGNEAKIMYKSCDFKDDGRVLKSAHPSGLAASAADPFIGNGHFKKCNQLLQEKDIPRINWRIENEEGYVYDPKDDLEKVEMDW